MPKIKIVFSDVDNTLITSNNEISPGVNAAIKNYVQAGGIFVLASARPPLGMRDLVKQLDCGALVICLNGALILQSSSNDAQTRILFEQAMRPNVLSTILKINESHHLSLSTNVFARQKWLVQKSDYWVQQEENITGAKATITPFEQQLGTAQQPVHKILCMGQPEEISVLEQQLEKYPQLHLSYQRSKPTYLEIVDASVSKMKAIEKVAEFTKTPLSQTMAIGDGENDLPMIKDAGIGIAVANSFPKVKAAADHVVSSNNDDGVAEALRKYTNMN